MSFFNRISGIFVVPSQGGPTKKKASAVVPVKKQVTQVPVIPVQKKETPVSAVVPNQQSAQIADATLREAQARAREIIVEAKAEALNLRETGEKELRSMREQIVTSERSIDQKLAGIEARLKVLDDREKEFIKRVSELDARNEKIEETRKQLSVKLEQVAGLTRDEAKAQLIEDVERKTTKEMAELVQEKVNRAKEEADDKAQEILVDAMKHGATTYVSEYTVSIVQLPSEDIKGKIIGKEGRNIRAFEQVTGVDVDLDDQPGSVRLSSFDPVRREVARITLERLIKDGRIQPSRIEEVIVKVREELDKIMFEEGKKLCHAVGVFNMPHDLIGYLGRFKYRFSSGQKMIPHTLEETKIGIALAHEVGANVDTVRLECLLHDIGKIITEEECNHVELGV